MKSKSPRERKAKTTMTTSWETKSKMKLRKDPKKSAKDTRKRTARRLYCPTKVHRKANSECKGSTCSTSGAGWRRSTKTKKSLFLWRSTKITSSRCLPTAPENTKQQGSSRPCGIPMSNWKARTKWKNHCRCLPSNPKRNSLFHKTTTNKNQLSPGKTLRT